LSTWRRKQALIRELTRKKGKKLKKEKREGGEGEVKEKKDSTTRGLRR